MDHLRVARDVLAYVGGAGNINAAAHCATRLRLVLDDMDRVDRAAFDRDPVIKGTFIAGGMFQIIVGPGDVDRVFDAMVTTGGVKEVSKEKVKQEAARSGNPLSRFIKTIADVFVPILPALIAGGLMMAIDNVLTAEGLFGGQNAPALTERWAWLADYADLINLISSAAFAFLPVLIGFSAAKRFGGNAYLGAAMGAAMVSSSLTSSYTAIQAQTAGTIGIWRLFGLTIDKIGYQAMVIPVLCVAWVLAAIEKRLHKRLSGTTDFLLTPLITMLATGFLTFVVVGPVTRVLSNGVTNGLAWTYNALGPIGGALFGLAYSPIVVTGLHQSFPAVEIPLIEGIKAGGAGSFIFPIASMANVAQGAAALAVFFKTADARMRGLAGAGGASALFGITEPAIFGVNLRLRWPFFIGMAAAGVGGAGVALLDVRSQALGAAGLVGLVSIVPTSIPRYLALEGLVFILAFVGVFAYATARSRSLTDDVDDAGTAVSKADAQLDSGTTSAVEFPRNAGADLSVTAPIHGTAISLSEVGDRTFASGVLGPGAAIDPVEGPVVSPVDGEVLVAFPTGHAYGLRSASGIELLIHVGMDTVELDGKYFTPRVAAGKRVHRGQVLVEVDWAAVTRAGYRTTTPVVVSNAASFAGIVDEHVGRIVERGDALYTVEAIEPVAARPPASA
ncbi:PTS beta-glucoside transporter subunit IIBCA [Actinomyces sp. oral taxon 448]|uniref:PTS beta-glucoside transporter subunit IIBCA n=1 Tax=Actinomyces sp. oral taxon 448 TaxID=712124 RepID=UPI0002189F55|nr:PTS transporter subunit IIBCA [Actinomyces sp. oral taxon 448]EGQ73621.1 PTS family sucrose porter, EIIBC component ScrA [Actinomyces sp. oral taxon 448 str. F0400]